LDTFRLRNKRAVRFLGLPRNSSIAKTARNLFIPASERDAKNPFAPTAEVLSEARAHFADHCATCHGNDGSGITEIGQNLYPKTPDLRQSET
jgi:mono/diheme cytochrome c family protein